MEASEIRCSTMASNALSTEMSLTPTPQTPPPTTPRTTTHTPREIPTMYILDQMYDDYMDQYNSNNITIPTESPDANASSQLSPCPICARTFNPVTLRKHVGICEKMTTKKRNKFDSFRQRREGTELAAYPLPKNFGLPEKTASSTSIGQARSDRGQSPKPLASTQQVSSPLLARKKPVEALIRSTARASMRKVAAAATNAAPAVSNVPASNFSRDRLRSSERSLTRRGGIQPLPAEQCPHCERCFGVKAYDRHVEWCKEKALQAAIKQGNAKVDGSVAKARLEARIKYRAPCLKTKRSMNRDKYSGLAGEENEPEDSPKPLKSNNKTQDNNLMTMSMTSSMTSERNSTNPTGNSNEPSKTATKTRKKTIRDKSQTSQPTPPTTTKTTTAATTEDVQDSVINYEMEMPDFRLMGEQMTTATINKKQRSKAIKANSKTSTACKSNKQQIISKNFNQKLETMDANINLPTSSGLAQRKSPSDLSLTSMRAKNSKEFYNADSGDDSGDEDYEHSDSDEFKSKELDDLDDLSSSLTYYSPSTKLLEEGFRKPKIMTKSLKNVQEKLNETFEVDRHFNKDCIDQTPPSSAHLKKKLKLNTKNIFHIEDEQPLNDSRANHNLTRNDGKRLQRKSEIINLDFNCDDKDEDTEDMSSFPATNPVNISQKRSKKLKPKHKLYTKENMIKEQTYGNEFSHSDEDIDSAATNDEYEINESILTSVPKLVIPKNNARNKIEKLLKKNQKVNDFAYLVSPKVMTNQKELRMSQSREEIVIEVKAKFGELSRPQSRASSVDYINEETGKDFAEFSENESASKHNISLRPESTKKYIKINTLERSDSKDKLLKTEIYKDCLTDSDELKLQKIKNVSSGSIENLNENSESISARTEKDLYTNCDEMRPSKVKSNTFMAESDHDSVRAQETEENPTYQKSMIAHLNKNDYSKPITSRSTTSKPSNYHCKTQSVKLPANSHEHNDSPRTPKTLRAPRVSTPPRQFPKLSSQPSLTTISHSTSNSTAFNLKSKVETTAIKPISICRPKRNKVIRQAVSCTSTLPMKAIPLPKECTEIYSVSSAPNIPNVHSAHEECANTDDGCVYGDNEYTAEEDEVIDGEEVGLENTCVMDKEIKVIKEPPQLQRYKSFTISGLPDNYDPFLSAKRQLEELCSPTSDFINIPTTPQTPKLPSLPATPNVNRMSTSLILSSTAPPNTIPSPMTTSQIPQQTPKTPTMARSSSFRRTASLRGPRRSPMLSTRPPLFAQKQRPTIQRGLSDEGPISTNFLKTEEYDEMPVRSVCVNDFAITKSPRVVRRDTSASNRKQQPLKLNINAGNTNAATSATASPNITEPDVVPNKTVSKYVSKTDSLAVFLKYEHELEKLNHSSTLADIKDETTTTTITTPSSSTPTPSTNLYGPLNAKELKDKSNNLSKQNSAKNIKADILELTSESPENGDHNLNTSSEISTQTNDVDATKYTHVRLVPLTSKPSTPLTKPSTPLTKPTTPTAITNTTTLQLTPLNVKITPHPTEHTKIPKSPKPVALSSIFVGDRSTKQPSHSSLLYAERKPSVGSDFIDPKLINKCDNLPINLNLKRPDFKHADSDNSEPRVEAFSSSSSESAAPVKNPSSHTQNTKFLPLVKQQPQEQSNKSNNLNINVHQNHSHPQHHNTPPISNSQRNSAEGRNLFKRRMRLGRNQFLYDASPEGDSCSADDEANRSSMECDNHNFIKDHEKAFERLSTAQVNTVDAPFIPPLPAFDDFDFEEFLSSFENDEEQFPLFKDCREFLLNRTSKKQRSVLVPNSNTQSNNNNNNSTNFKKSTPQTFPPLTPQAQSTPIQQHFLFPSLPQHPKNSFNSFSFNTRAKNKFDDLTNTRSTDAFDLNSNSEDFQDEDNHQKREIFISIETEQNDLDKSAISPNSIRNMVGNPQTVVEVELDAAHDNKFSKISDDDADTAANHGVIKSSSMTRCNNFPGHLERLPNVQLNNAKNLIQRMQDDFRHMGDDMNANVRQTMDHRSNTQSDMNANSSPMPVSRHTKKAAGTPSGDGYADSDELSSLDGYPLSSPNSRFGVSSKTSADSAYGSLSRQRSSELTSQRNSSRSRPNTSTTANTLLSRPLMEESSLGRSRQLSASSSSSSEQALPPIAANNNYAKQQQHLYNNNNNMANDLDDMMRYERNNNYDAQPMHPSTSAGIANSNSHSNLESSSQLYSSNSTMSTSMKMSRFCHECGSKFLVDQAKFCMDCGVKRIVV